MKLGNRNTNKKTVMGGVGIALLLCALMVGMTMTNLVQTDAPLVETEFAVVNEDSEDHFALPDVYEPVEYEYDETSEIEGMRSMNQKAFLTESGETALLTSAEPMHYMSSIGSWEEIDLNIKATVNGWEVKENIYEVAFSPEASDGVSVMVHPNVDPIVTGLNPVVMTFDESGTMSMPYMVSPSQDGASVGGNVLRYSLADGFDLDYSVEETQLKQNLVIRERPVLQEDVAWFGLTEQMRLPVGYGLYLGDDVLREEMTQTQDELSIRNLETGELLATIPVPVVEEADSTEPYHATYFVQVFGNTVVLSTVVDADWLMEDERQFPLAIDPSIKVMAGGGGYCYVYYAYCYNNSYRRLYRYYGTLYYLPWNKYTFTSSNALPTGATVDKIEWKQYMSYSFSYSSNTVKAVVMESCGMSNRYSSSIPSSSCSGALTTLTAGYGGTTQRKMISSIWNSAQAGTYATGTGWKTASICSSSTACSATSGSHTYITNALANGGSVGMGARYTTSTYHSSYAYATGSSNSYLQVTYSGGSDTTSPTDEFVPYTGITSYKEGERTFFTTLKDSSGIDTTTSGAPHLHYSIDNGSYTAVKATTLGTCNSSSTDCKFRATTSDISTDEYVKYFWAFQDLAATPNAATSPSGGSGTPSTASAPTTPYWFYVGDVEDAGDDKKMTITTTDVRAYTTTSTAKTFDRQMTYYEDSDEYVFEFDTSECGTGSNSCFYTSSYYFYAQWKMMWTTAPSSGYNGLGGTTSGVMEMHQTDGGYLTLSADDGPGMNLIYLYDSSSNEWAMVGLGTDTGIDETLTSGTNAPKRTTYGYTAAHLVDIPGDITGTFGKFDFNATYSSSKANWMCVGTNGWYYFFRSTSSNPSCTSGYYYVYSSSYRWSGFALATGYYGPQASSGSVVYKVANVAPEPDTTKPEVDHLAMRDSHSRDRTFTFTITDGGEPPSGINVSSSAGVGPTMYYRVTDADGTVNSWTSKVLSPVGKTRAACEMASCDWSSSLEDLERGSSVEYYMTATDLSVASTGTNTNTTTTNSFEVGDPNKVFVVEWHDLGYTSSYQCSFQVLMYDVTNEIEFHYDTNCQATYDYATVGYQDQTRTKGATLRASTGYINGANPHSSNYRIGTDSSGHGYESFDLGMTELPTYDTAIAGSSNGYPYGYYCVSSYYWNSYKAGCNANVDLPDGFTFDYFGTEYNGSDSKNRVHIGRMGNMYLKDDGSTSLERSITTWYSNMPDMPYNGNSMSKAGNIAPWWGYYSSYYCYDNSNIDCSVRTRVIPFEGKGTDVSADITQPTTWSAIDSPIRINPSSSTGYLSIGDDLTIEPGVVIQVASGKGLSFDGSCSEFSAVGNSTDHILFEGMQGADWKGLSFTGACSTGTDDRHEMSYVDFANTSDAAIAAGSRHGASPSSNANVGNFTMDHVTFTNVGSAFEHGSGQGTVLTMSDFEVNDASDSCFDFAEDSEVTLRDGEMNDCNSAGSLTHGAVMVMAGVSSSTASTAGSLIMENVDISDSRVNLISVDFTTVWMSNVTATSAQAEAGTVLTSAGDGTGSSVYIYNMVADGYSSAAIHALDSIKMETVDWGSANVGMSPGGTTSTAAGPSGLSSASIDDFTAGDLTMARMAPTMDDIDIGALLIMGNSPGGDAIAGENWDTDGISVSGCGYAVVADAVTTDAISGSCSNSASPNNIQLSDVDATYTGTLNAVYARNSQITIGEGEITMPTTFDKMSKASTNGRIILIDVAQDGTTCDGSSGCDVSSSSSGAIYFGGLATVKVFKLLGDGSKDYKEGHTVQATVVDAGSALFTIGTHTTDSNGETSAWVLTSNDAGDSFTDHNLAAWGPSGQNETMTTDSWYPGSFGVGDSIELRLEPAPVSLNGTNMDCSYLQTNTEAALGMSTEADGTKTFTWEGKVTMTGDLNIDTCNIIMRNVFTVASDATNKPTLTISPGGTLTLEATSTDTGTLKATSSTYPLDLDMDGGALTLDGGVIRDVAGGINLDSGTMTVGNSAMIYGNANAAATEATVYVNGGTLDWDDSTIMNSGQTGIGLMFEQTGGAVDNIVVKNAAVGIYSYNAVPTINGFTLTDNDVGVDVYGGMTLPTIYRSTLLSGESTGWKTYAIDMSPYLAGGEDYMQVGFNSVYAGGNAHPRYNYATSKYYMMTDRMNIELTDNAGNSWNVTQSSDEGYYQNAPSHDCNTYGYSYNPWYGYSYNKPSGFNWESTDSSPSTYYPMHYWGYYYTSYHAYGQAQYTPPEGFQGSYNVCLHYAYSYYNSPGDSVRLTYPTVDVSANNITGVTMYIDVLHNRADNYQDRLEVIARVGDDPSDLGSYVRESGTPSFSTGTITGAENGVEIGGAAAAGEFNDITVTNPVNAGLAITGSASSTVDGLTVSGGNYGIIAGAAASGSVGFSNVDVSGTSLSGVYYIKDIAGDLEGTISGSAGSGVQFGSATSKDITWSGMDLTTNAVGIETAGSGKITLIDSDFGNGKDIVITGSAVVDFVEGTIDTTSVDVTGTGVLNRMRQIDVSVEADTSAVSGANVVLKNSEGAITGSSVTDSSGDAMDIQFVTQTVDSTGLSTMNLAGYEAVTVAQVGSYSYTSSSSNSGDFRYAFDSLSLSDASGNSHAIDLVDSVDVRICYSYSSTTYAYVAQCASGLSTGGTRTYSSGLVEYGYYGATPRSLDNKVVMVDVGVWYMDGNTDNSMNGTTVLSTGSYKNYDAMSIYSTSPYGANIYSHGSEWTSLATDDGEAQGIKIGYTNWNDIVPSIEDTTITGLSTIVTSKGTSSAINGYGKQADMFHIVNNTFTHFRDTGEITGSIQGADICLDTAAFNTTITGNTMTNCGVNVMLRREAFYYYYQSAQWGVDNAIVDNNTFINTGSLGVWFALNTNSDGVEITNNEFYGTNIATYGIYAQDRTTTDVLIQGNTISSAKYPIFMRGALDWDISDNTITGIGDSAYAGILVRDGNGVIDGNTLTDADGGIQVDGIRYGYTANLTDNTIGQSAGRVAPSAVGLWAEDCGSSVVNSVGNTVSVMENALVTDGCDVVDTGSSLSAIGGAGGSLYNVQINANAFAPSTITINEGDTVRWRSNEYQNSSNPYHNVESNGTDAGGMPLWASPSVMNLGTTYTKTFNTAGTYEYHCSNHPTTMWGTVTVTTGSSGGFTSVGVNVVGSNDEITLDGTSVSGFSASVEQYGGALTLEGGAILTGGAYGAYVEDTDVVVDGASLIANTATGSAMYITGTSSMDATDMDTSGLYGLYTDAVDFRWNGGDSDAGTALMADGGAEGSVENVTWADATTQIDAGSYVTVTSVGNTVDNAKLIVDSTAVIHEGNLLDLDITHLGGSTTDVGLLIQSTDGAQAAYVSPAYRAPYMTADGDTSEWFGNTKNPSDDAMPGVMSSDDAGEDFLATWDANNLYLALTGVDMGSADLQIYIDSSTGGDTTGDSWYVSHSLPFAADYVFWAEDDSTNGLKVNGFTGWSATTCSALSSTIGDTSDTDTEIAIPWDCIGQPDSTVRMLVVVQDESTGAVESVHPDQTIATGAVGQTFNDELTLLMGHGDLAEGDDLRNHLLIYRSYVGSNTPSDAKTYDIAVKVDATCEEDWGNINSVDMSTNVAESIDIKRACPVITSLVDVTVDEDSGSYTLTLTDKADDVQDEESTLTWTVADDADPSRSPTMLLDSGLSGQTMTITPDHDQFGSYVFHFGVEDSHGLTDSATITFSVTNVNDAPIICNDERADCMPVFADDGAGNLNVLDEGFGSVSKVLGSAANATGSYVIDMASNDMANEQPQTYTWAASIKGDEVTVDPYYVQKKYSTVAEMFAEVGGAIVGDSGWNDIEMTGDPSDPSVTPNGTYTLPTLNDVPLLTYLLAQNGCGSVWYMEYMDSSANKVTAVRSDDGCDSSIDTNAKVYNGLNYTDFWMEAYGVDTEAGWDDWDTVFPDGYSLTTGYDPCPAYSVVVSNNELTIIENAANELGGECTIVLSLQDDGGYCANTFLGRTTDIKASCVSYTWLVNYPVNHPVYGPITVTGCYNLYLGLASFIPEYLADGTPTGMSETICLAYSWVAENVDAVDYEVNFSVTPVNDAPEVLDWDRQEGVVISDGNGEVPNFPWKVTLTEDDENVDNLTYDLSAMKHDNDHLDEDLDWTIVKSDTCDYEDYFSATITGDDIAFDLIKDATTNAPEWEVDYLNNGGIHQKNPLSGEFCPITLYLHDTATAPSYVPNYGMSTANYQQGEDSVTLYVRVDNVAENVPDYFLDSTSGFDYNQVSNIMPKTYVPTTVTIGHGGDEGPYNYDHMLEVTFHSNGYNNDDATGDDYVTLGTQYVTPPAYGETIDVTDYVYITGTSSRIWVEVDVLTCVAETCDMTASPADRYFGYSFPYAHKCVNLGEQSEVAWSCPGEVGSSTVDANGNPSAVTLESKRRPMLEDQDWCNNIMSTDDNGSECDQPRTFGKVTEATGQNLPTVVRLIGTADVPSFAPTIIAISAAGLFVSALVLQSRRDEEEEALEDLILEDDEQAVSPVIATILMVAITVVLSGVIYVWASSLADTSAKGVPRMTFDVDSNGEFHRITVTGSQVELATQAMEVQVDYTDASGAGVSETYNLADTTVYGFYPGNSDSLVTFTDSVGSSNGDTKSSFDTGDTIYVKSVDANGDAIFDMYVSISYVPNTGEGAVLRTWDSL